MPHPFLEAVARGAVLADGAMGTLLRARGWDGPTDCAVLDDPSLVRRVHEDYIAAGSDLLLTNTFEANRALLARTSHARRVRDANFQAARIARDAREIAGMPVLVGGSVGPIGRELAVGAWTLDDAYEAFREQIGALLEGGVDLLVLETFPSLVEATTALRAARSLTDLPAVVMLNFNADLATPAGEPAAEVARTLAAAGAQVVGVNCGVGPQAALDMLQEMASQADVLGDVGLAVKPNAGLPRVVQGRRIWPAEPEYLADFALRARDLGAVFIGGCCGTTPEHVRAMREALGSGRRPSVVVHGAPQLDPPPLEEPLAPAASTLRQKLQAGTYAISVEIDPPRGINPRKAIEGAALLYQAGADAINIGDSPMARVRMSALALAIQIQQQVGIETIIHQTSRDRNLMALQSDLLGAHALGIRNVIALTGDPPPEASQSSAVWDVDSIGFIRVLKRLNEGVDFAGNSLGRPTEFFVAGAANPTADDLDLELRRVRDKVEAGADLLMTQPAYDVAVVRDFFERLGPIGIPVLLGVLPLMSSRHTEFIHHELAGVTVPDAVRERMRLAGEAGAAAGLEIALEHVEETRTLPFVSGIYVMPSFGRYEVAAELVRQVAGRR
ncbi:MAG: bifunctional homocysteine S-methyltransferase/methylenetetrahydrofolate reductase [Dehalococcoidia bacterium]